MNPVTSAFILIAVTYGGNVSSSGYPTLNACHEAKSIATTGLTIEANQAAADKADAARKAFYAAHPPRQPHTDGERSDVSYPGMMTWGLGGIGYSVTSEHLIQDEPPTNGAVITFQDGNTIKYAACVPAGGDVP